MYHLHLTTFATLYSIRLEDAYVLPALFERASEKVGLPASGLLSQAIYNKPLGEYLANAARKVAAEDRGA